jgi:hypothetical protein
VILSVSLSTIGIIPIGHMLMDGKRSNSLAQEKRLFCVQNELMPSSFGESSSTIPDSKELIVLCLEMNPHTAPQTLFAKRIRLLIASGLIVGITPTSTAKKSAQQTLDFAFSPLGGADADGQREDF